ncbi:cyclopropane-fatty-acyl-phospholipid synthase family protein [Variovorax ureilyticus]|uniref:Cyclopropane-fatty-acyl-phospholipid synthase family protein n=1 Tax=Variovorax ureilyticus TaxID=1836198 RepID=A0ABU8VPD2_9BURK
MTTQGHPAAGATGPRSAASGSRHQGLLLAALDKYVQKGRIAFVMNGQSAVVGRGEELDVRVRVHSHDFYRKVICYGNLGLAEAFMAGDFDVDDEQLPQLLTLLLQSRLDAQLAHDLHFVIHYAWIRLMNFAVSRKTNVQRHYDIGAELFDAFLRDRYQVYSCGYAHSVGDDIDSLQRNKLERICQKLKLRSGHRMLDIGCGGAGLLIHAALNHGIRGVGITNSRAHHQLALRNIRAHGLEDRIAIEFGDFSGVAGKFDRVASVGMLEHVPPRTVSTFFRKVASVLTPGGWALVHAIGLNAAKNKHDPFIQKYIFPGSDTPKLSVMARNIEANHLAIIDVENIVRHYAITCRRWLEAFRCNRHTLDESYYDASFKRMWEYYLSCGIAAATAGNLAVYQLLFTGDYHAPYSFQRV